MSLFVISDLHICGPDDPLYFSLLSLIRDRAKAGDTVVLAGDLFDLFVGNKAVFKERYSGFLKVLSDAGQQGVDFHYIEGNHDFLIDRVFRGIPRFTVHSHDVSLEIQGKRFYFAHGDTADRRDYPYLLLRSFFRSPMMKLLVFLAPGDWLDRFGKFSSHRSRQAKALLPIDLPIHRMERLRKIYRSYAAERLAQGYDYVVMGHCHDLDEMFFNIGGRPGQYVNVGYPRAHGSFLSWSPGEERIQRERLPS
jgi:UDP-2,3-diacylglucosamine hydrolase